MPKKGATRYHKKYEAKYSPKYGPKKKSAQILSANEKSGRGYRGGKTMKHSRRKGY